MTSAGHAGPKYGRSHTCCVSQRTGPNVGAALFCPFEVHGLMSVEAVKAVLDHSKQAGNALTLLLVLAEYADANGFSWPGIEALAARARVSVRAAQYLLPKLEAAGELRVERHPGRNKVNHYWILLAGKGASVVAPISPPEKVQMVQLRSEMVQIEALNGATTIRNGATAIAPDPLRTIIDPPRTTNITAARGKTQRVETWGKYGNQEKFTTALLEELSADLGEAWVRDTVDQALDHKARKSYTRMDLYVGGWVRRNAADEKTRRSRNGRSPHVSGPTFAGNNGSSAGAGSRPSRISDELRERIEREGR